MAAPRSSDPTKLSRVDPKQRSRVGREQLSLFDEPAEPLPDVGEVAPFSSGERFQMSLFGGDGEVAGVDPELVALAEALPRHVRFGTSSWTFSGWKGLVYRRAYKNERTFLRESLSEYATHPLFRTVGIDRSYYAPIPETDLADYARQLPVDFRAVSKVWSEITTPVFPNHPRYGDRAGRANPLFLDPRAFVDAMGEPYTRAFRANAGPFVVEIPPSRLSAPDLERALDRFLTETRGTFPFAIELRNRTLLTARYLRILRAHGATHVFNFWERMPTIGAQMAIEGTLPGPFVVARVLIPPGERYADLKEAWAPFDKLVEPQPAMREDVCALIERAGQRGIDVYVIVNNKAEGSSPLTVEGVARQLVDRARLRAR